MSRNLTVIFKFLTTKFVFAHFFSFKRIHETDSLGAVKDGVSEL